MWVCVWVCVGVCVGVCGCVCVCVCVCLRVLTAVGELHSLTDWQVSEASEEAELVDFCEREGGERGEVETEYGGGGREMK